MPTKRNRNGPRAVPARSGHQRIRSRETEPRFPAAERAASPGRLAVRRWYQDAPAALRMPHLRVTLKRAFCLIHDERYDEQAARRTEKPATVGSASGDRRPGFTG